ncbi:restriction endonuclease subunit S [Vibrio splendidus]
MSWPLVNLESVAHINPRLPKGTDESQVVTFLKMASVSEGGELLEQEKRILSETKKGFTYFEKDDVLLAKITPCFENGKAALLDDLETPLGFGSTEFHVLRAAEGKLDSKYLFHLVWNEEFRFLGKHAMKGAAGQQRISTDFLKNLKIPLPPLETQKQIAAVLEKADQLRKDCQQMERELNGLAQSVFIDMFGDPVTNPKGWDKCSIGDITSKVTDGEHQTPKRTDSGYKLLSARNIQHGHLDVVNEKVDYVGEDEFKRITKRLVIEKSDVLLSCSGTIGRAALNTLDEPFCLVRSAAVIRLLQEFMLPEFLVGYLGTSYMQAVMHHEANSSGQPNLFQNQIKKLKVYTPPIELQEGFKVFLEHQKIELLNLKCLKSEYDEAFNSLMQKAFKGELNL